MRIVEKIKGVVEHTTDSWQQKLLNEYSHGDEPATRARKIISELVRSLDKPNQVIVNDIVSLIYALATNPDPTIDLEQIVSTAQLLIHELVEPIPNPDKRLMDELLNLVIHAAHAPTNRANAMNSSASPQMAMQQNSSMSVNQTGPGASTSSAQPQYGAVAPSQPNQSPVAMKEATPVMSSPAQSSSSSKSPVDQTMIKLIMDEMKEVIKKNQLTEQRITDTENKLTGRLSSTFDDIQSIKDKVKKQEAELETINKNLDKFISLYEIVINQYNPFIEHLDDPKKKEIPTSSVANSTPAPTTATTTVTNDTTASAAKTIASNKKAAEDSAVDSTLAASDQDNLSVIIEEVKKTNDTDFAAGKEKMSKWIRSVIKDDALAQAYSEAKGPQEAVKVLLKKSLQMHMTDTKSPSKA